MKEFGITLYGAPIDATTPRLAWDIVRTLDGEVLESGVIVASKILTLPDGAELRVREC